MDVTTFLAALISAMLINNVILMQFLGICPFLGVSKKMESSIGMASAVGFVMIIASITTSLINKYILVPADIEFMQTIAFILVIASLVQLVEMVLKKYSKTMYQALGVYLPLITTNCAILGVSQMNVSSGYTFDIMLANTIGSALGFALVIIAFTAIRERLDAKTVNPYFKGIPISLVIASFMSLAFMGLSGVI